MKELKGYQVELLVNYLKKGINRNRETAEKARETSATPFTAMSYDKAAHELDCALAYLMGLMYEEV